jgi:hypothetical protein
VDICSPIWYIRALDVKGVAFVGPSDVSAFKI